MDVSIGLQSTLRAREDLGSSDVVVDGEASTTGSGGVGFVDDEHFLVAILLRHVEQTLLEGVVRPRVHGATCLAGQPRVGDHSLDFKYREQDDVEVSEEPDTCFAMKVIFQVFDSIDPAVL